MDYPRLTEAGIDLMQSPLLSVSLKQTNEVDWIDPLKRYIRSSYQDDPERYSEECASLNRLRQDMRGAGKDSISGRDLLYRYYGQLELLDLRFPVDENHIKISFTWYDAFSNEPISQYSLAYEKASVIFNISAVLASYAAIQDRQDDSRLKAAFQSLQASAGMFTYINENFLHAPSADLSRETIKTLISITLAQAQEVFLEKQIKDNKKAGMLGKLASQAGFLYTQALAEMGDPAGRTTFESLWPLLLQIKACYLTGLAQYYQGLADAEANAQGSSIARLQVGLNQAKEANRLSTMFPYSVSAESNLPSETRAILMDLTKRQIVACTEKLAEFNKDNDYIYHQVVPSESTLSAVGKLPAAKPIPVSELYPGTEIHRVVGPDIFQRIVPMSVTESASLYDEEKAKMARSEAERVEIANDELTAALDYLKLPGSLNIVKGSSDRDLALDPEFKQWCNDCVDNNVSSSAIDHNSSVREEIIKSLEDLSRNLDMEQSVCEKMRNKHGSDWTQQPSSSLTSTLRGDIRSYRSAIDQALKSDRQVQSIYKQYQVDIDAMKSAAEQGVIDDLYQRAMFNTSGAGSGVNASKSETNLLDDVEDDTTTSIAEQVTDIEEMMRKLQLVKRERQQVLKDLKEKIQSDDISSVLIINKKAITSADHQIFKNELEKFTPYQNRILQSNHKQMTLIKGLTRAYSDLLNDKRVKVEQNKYEQRSRQKNNVLNKYRKAHQAFLDVKAGVERGSYFYTDMKANVESLTENVQSFVSNRKSEGLDLLAVVERRKTAGLDNRNQQDQERMKDLMQRMSMSNTSMYERPSPATPLAQSSGNPLQQAYNNLPPQSYNYPSQTFQQSSVAYNPHQPSNPQSPPINYNSRPSISSPNGQMAYTSPTMPQQMPTMPNPNSYQQSQQWTLPTNQQQRPSSTNEADPWAGLGVWK